MYPMSLRQTSRGFASEVNLSSQDVFNVFEGDVPTHHVIKQHAKRPDSGTVTMVEGSVPGESRHQVYIYIPYFSDYKLHFFSWFGWLWLYSDATYILKYVGNFTCSC